LSRGHPRGLYTARLYRLWSREAIRRIFRYCFHLVNSLTVKAKSPGATLDFFYRFDHHLVSLIIPLQETRFQVAQ